MSGYQICDWAQTYMFLPRYDCDHTIITCQGTNVSGHKCFWAQTCLGTNMSGHKRHNVFGHNRVGIIVWAQVCMGTNVWSPFWMRFTYRRELRRTNCLNELRIAFAHTRTVRLRIIGDWWKNKELVRVWMNYLLGSLKPELQNIVWEIDRPSDLMTSTQMVFAMRPNDHESLRHFSRHDYTRPYRFGGWPEKSALETST